MGSVNSGLQRLFIDSHRCGRERWRCARLRRRTAEMAMDSTFLVQGLLAVVAAMIVIAYMIIVHDPA